MNPDVGRWRAAVAAGVLAGLAALCGCSGPVTPSQVTKSAPPTFSVAPPSLSATPQVDTVSGRTLPTEVYEPTAAEHDVIDQAVRQLTTQCMARFGFTWDPPDVPYLNVEQLDREWGVADLATAQKYGYHLSPADGGGHPKPSGPPPAGSSYSKAELLVLSGSRHAGAGPEATTSPGTYGGKEIPAGGCAGQANARVMDPKVVALGDVANGIGGAMYEKAKSDPRVVAVFKAWSVCMKRSGYDYATPLDAVGAMSSGPDPSAAEIQTAVADVRCKQQTNLLGIAFAVQTGYEKAAIQQNLQRLDAFRNAWAEAARKAAAILGVPAPAPQPTS